MNSSCNTGSKGAPADPKQALLQKHLNNAKGKAQGKQPQR